VLPLDERRVEMVVVEMVAVLRPSGERVRRVRRSWGTGRGGRTTLAMVLLSIIGAVGAHLALIAMHAVPLIVAWAWSRQNATVRGCSSSFGFAGCKPWTASHLQGLTQCTYGVGISSLRVQSFVILELFRRLCSESLPSNSEMLDGVDATFKIGQ
jgi:hypothetical protein